MKTYISAVLFVVFLLTACNNNQQPGKSTDAKVKDSVSTNLTNLSATTDVKKLLCQNWENKEDAEDAALSGAGPGLETTYRGFSFFEDATVVQNPRDKMRFGKWTMDDATKLISFDFGKGGKAKYKIVAIGAKQMILMNTSDNKKVEYRADAKAQKNPSDDPFYATNNEWRIKPGRSETDSAVKLRAEQCVLFYAKFLKDNADRGNNVISFAGLPTCFKWYRGGVSVTGKEKLGASFLNCFYNDEQAFKAQEMLEKIISKKYKWNKEEKNWVMQSADVVRQMYDTLKKI